MRKLFTVALILALCLTEASQAEVLSFDSDHFKLHVDLPADWVEAEDPNKFVFISPDGNGAILIAPSSIPVTPTFMEGISPDFVQDWILSESNGNFTDIKQLLFAKAIDEDGNLYAISSCGCTVDDTPLIYAHYFYTASDGTLASVTSVSINNEAGLPARNWLDQVITVVIPEGVFAVLAAQIQ